ncbi:MAG: FG-GAP-like repeat-containing protein, partial [Opitutaceae bacterium]|nr:FG-GAP-like repeat-containing protein [Opitutaceae bacterium]
MQSDVGRKGGRRPIGRDCAGHIVQGWHLVRTEVAAIAILVLAAALHGAPLNLVPEPVGSGLYSALVNDSFSAVGVASADDWSFEGEVGDRVSARIEAVVGTSRPKVRLLNASGTVLFSFDGGTDGVGVMYAYRITTPGTYRLRVYTDNAISDYAMRVDLGRGLDLEVEANDTLGTANLIVPKVGAGKFDFSVAGLVPATDTAGDTFALGLAPAGSTLTATVQLPSSTLTAADLSLRLFEQRTGDRALDFNGSTYATVPHNAVFDAIETANAVTLEAWIYIRSWPQGYFLIFDKYEQTGDWGWAFAIQNGGGGISFWNGANTRATSDVTPSLNIWHHVAVVYDHAAGASAVRFYLDGALIATKASPGALLNTDGEPAYIGFSPGGGDEYSNGPISEIRLWNRALTTAEIQANYAAANLAGSETNLVGLWRFDEGSGVVGVDSSATANNAVLGGGDPTRVPGWTTGSIRPLAPVAGTSLNRTFPAEATTWLQLSAAANRGISGRYFLSGSVTDAVSLNVVSTTLPVAGGSTTDYIQSFTVTFDDELDPVQANNLANIDLRAAGPNGLFGDTDDVVYTLGSPNYVNGTVLSFAILNGPLQPGSLRLTVGLGMRDRAGNPLGATFTREFTAQLLNGFRVENQNNGTFATATSLAATGGEGAGYGGSWRDGVEYATGGANPYGVGTADFDGDGRLDLVSANYNAGTISVLKGNGDGTFGTAVTYAAPNNPFTLAVGDVNGDGKPDVVVTRINGNAVRVFLNTGAGGVLAAGVDYATGTQPHRLVLQDLNGDGRLDIATANNGANSVSVLYGNGVGAVGDGTFGAKVDFAVSGSPYAIAAGNLNGDGRVDLAVGTNGDRAVKVFNRQVDGTYLAGDVFAWGPSYGVMAVAIGDVNGDGRADLLAVQEYNTPIRRWHQQADGTLVEGAVFNQAVSLHGYSLLVQDLSGDGKPEVISGGYYNINVFENQGAGVFA